MKLHAAILFGQLTAARARIEDGPLSQAEGGGLLEFQIELEHVDGGGPNWFGLCWTMQRMGLLIPSWELFEQDVILGGNMQAQHNTGTASVQIITAIQGFDGDNDPGDDYPDSMAPADAFAGFIADTNLTPWGLGLVNP